MPSPTHNNLNLSDAKSLYCGKLSFFPEVPSRIKRLLLDVVSEQIGVAMAKKMEIFQTALISFDLT